MARISLLAVCAAVVIGDRVTKIAIRQNLDDSGFISIIPGWLRIIHTENPGAAFGLLATGAPAIRGLVLIGVSAAVLVFVLSAMLKKQTSPLWTRLGLALILSGALGNLYDRVFLGTVTDFIEVYHGTWSFPAFNVADSAITVGAALLFLELLFDRKKSAAQPAAQNNT